VGLRGVGLGREALAELLEQGRAGGRGGGGGDAADAALVVDDVHQAPVGEGGDDELGEPLQGDGVVERGGEQGTGLGKEGEAALGLLGGGAGAALGLQQAGLAHGGGG